MYNIKVSFLIFTPSQSEGKKKGSKLNYPFRKGSLVESHAGAISGKQLSARLQTLKIREFNWLNAQVRTTDFKVCGFSVIFSEWKIKQS
ncbi:hypothetical protein TNIN_176061 [Trichonephila inaurata madagascariensis]|uniref:Uncharacterized protein n=1 Tax=Trichonephila inaurata madagascariensis TaxID=2747483 RepID=A0A8X6Y0U0_9ARAC|nr:hypothetical protein TNIN_176061 [Trichonephila inaurata madagascariensis]